MAKRYELTDEQFAVIGDLLPGKPGDRGRTAQDNHRFVNGVLWVLRSGANWHDLPERYGTGSRRINASVAGPSPGCGRRYFKDC